MKAENKSTEISERMGNYPCAFSILVIGVLQ